MRRPGFLVLWLGIALLIVWLLLHASYLIWYFKDAQLPSEERRLRSWEHPVGILSNLVFGASGMFLALAIFSRSGKQIELLQERVFHTLIDPESVTNQVAEMVADANTRKDSKLLVMVYWLWFGADEIISREGSAIANSGLIVGECSRLWKLLKHRAIEGHETTIVAFDPNSNGEKVFAFIKATLGWWGKHVGKGSEDEFSRGAEDLLGRYRSDLRAFETEITGKRNTKFQKPVFRDSIPMIMFAATDPTGWAHGLIYIAEVDALKSGAKLGAFYSRDLKIVEVMRAQIEALAVDGHATMRTDAPNKVVSANHPPTPRPDPTSRPV